MKIPKFLLGVAALPLLSTTSPADRILSATSLSYGPQGAVRVASPTIAWQIVPDDDSDAVATRMVVNGTQVPAQYDAVDHSLEYAPATLAPGTYNVSAQVTFRGGYSFDQAWAFSVSGNAVRALPEANAHQIQALNAVNSFRNLLGLPHVTMDARLNSAADAHSRYLDVNNAYGHDEQPGKPAFAGATPDDRLTSFGWSQGHYEDVSTGLSSPRQSIAGLFDAPYHRLPFMQPGTFPVGSGFRGDSFSLEFGLSSATGSVVSPANGQSSVPTTWDGNEDPSPTRISGLRGRTGYPILFAYFTPGLRGIRVTSARLTVGGQEVPIAVNTPANDDHLTNAAIILPKHPLLSGVEYQASVTAIADDGVPIVRSWTFRTR